MDEQEPKEQFEATDYDEEGNIKLPPPPLAAAKQKRPTVAGLKKDLDDLEEIISEEVYSWLDKLDSRVNHIEVMMNDVPPTFAHDVIARLDKIDEFPEIDRLAEIAALDRRIDDQDTAIGALADAVRSHLADVAVMKSKPEPELEFAQPPQQMAGGQWRKSDIEAVASICQHMTDVLMICRALKAMPDLPDEDRTYLLTTACRAAGVPLSPGLQIRAGVRNVEA